MWTGNGLDDIVRTEVVHEAPGKVCCATIGMEYKVWSGISDGNRLIQCANYEPSAVSLSDFVADDLACKDVNDGAEVDLRPVEGMFGHIARP